jgi:RNA polymerase sigma-70 factor (ECF subfamily)
VAGSLLPHEAEVRGWLRRRVSRPEDVDDLIQEAYCRVWSVQEPRVIENPRAYFFQTVRSVLIDQIRRAAVVNISAMADIESLPIVEDCSSPERIVAGRLDLMRVQALIDALPERCRRIIQMRKIEDKSQREIAQALGVSEGVVENELGRGLKLILAAFEKEDGPRPVGRIQWKAKSRGSRRDR